MGRSRDPVFVLKQLCPYTISVETCCHTVGNHHWSLREWEVSFNCSLMDQIKDDIFFYISIKRWGILSGFMSPANQNFTKQWLLLGSIWIDSVFQRTICLLYIDVVLADQIIGWLQGYLFLHHNSVDKGIGGMALKIVLITEVRGLGPWSLSELTIKSLVIYHKPWASKTFHWASKFLNHPPSARPTVGDWGWDFMDLDYSTHVEASAIG